MTAERANGAWYRDIPLSAKWPIFTGLAILVVWLGCFGVWALIAPLNSAVVAKGTFMATGQNKLIQYLEGGIIREIAVKEGDLVEANHPRPFGRYRCQSQAEASGLEEISAAGHEGASRGRNALFADNRYSGRVQQGEG